MDRDGNNELQDDERKQVVVQKDFNFNVIDHYTEQTTENSPNYKCFL